MLGGKNVKEKFGLLVTILILVATGTITTAHSEGIHGDFVKNGCACHGSAPSDEVTVLIEGLPSVYNASQNYSLSIIITGGPEANGVNHGGFNLRVGAGTLSKNASDDNVLIAQQSLEATHTSAGTRQYVWNVTWVAPDNDEFLVEIRAFGNAVNGDESPAGDAWAGFTISIPGQNWTETGDADSLTDTIMIVVVLAGSLIISAWMMVILLRREIKEDE